MMETASTVSETPPGGDEDDDGGGGGEFNSGFLPDPEAAIVPAPLSPSGPRGQDSENTLNSALSSSTTSLDVHVHSTPLGPADPAASSSRL